MNETLKGVAHIGAELAAAKADLQLEMERHRKTWRQLEQVNNAMRRIIERCEVFIDDEAEMSTASVEVLMGIAEDALSQQAEPLEPAPAQDETVYQLQRLGAPAGWRDADKEAYDSAAKMDGYLRRTLYRRPAQTEQQPEQSEALAWKVLEAATDALDRRAAPHAWLSQTWEAGSKIITSRRAAMSTPPSPATAPSNE